MKLAVPKTQKLSNGSNTPVAEPPFEGFAPGSVESVAVDVLKPNPRNARTHSAAQITAIARSIRSFGFNVPVLVDSDNRVVAGHGRLAAARQLGLATVPVLRLAHLSKAQIRAYALADNKLCERGGWDRELLAIELSELADILPDIGLDVVDTGFEIGEIDSLFADRDRSPPPAVSEAEADPLPALPKTPVTRSRDLWVLGPHRLLCGDARDPDDIDRLMDGRKADVVFSDPPYNVRVNGHVGGRGAIRHEEFAFASGEMSEAEFIGFLTQALTQMVRVARDGAILFVCMDWRHVVELSTAAKACALRHLNTCVWTKSTPGQGSLYRSQHEFILVFRIGDVAHRNGVSQGRFGRNRSNVWSYPGASAFKAGGREELASHPTVKPVPLVADALRDTSVKSETVLDPFSGSGTTLIAAERIGRKFRGVEYEPKYVDVAVRRWQDLTKLEAVHAETGRTFAQVAALRAAEDRPKSVPAPEPSGEPAPASAPNGEDAL